MPGWSRTDEEGFSLLELVVVLAILGVLLGMAWPALSGWLERRRLLAAADALQDVLSVTQQQALAHDARLYLAFVPLAADGWQVVRSELAACRSAACGTQVLGDDDYPGIRLVSTTFSGNQTEFDPVRGLADNGKVVLESRGGLRAGVVLSSVGRIRRCGEGTREAC